MALDLTRSLDIAAPRLNAVRERQLTGSSAGSSLPAPRGASVSARGMNLARLRSYASQGGRGRALTSGWGLRFSAGPYPVPSMRAPYLDALERTVAAVRADQLIAGRRHPQGDLRPT